MPIRCMSAAFSIFPLVTGWGRRREGNTLSSACVRHRSSAKTNTKTKGVKLVSLTTEKELLPQQLCYCLGSGHLRGVKELEDFASRREECKECRRAS